MNPELLKERDESVTARERSRDVIVPITIVTKQRTIRILSIVPERAVIGFMLIIAWALPSYRIGRRAKRKLIHQVSQSYLERLMQISNLTIEEKIRLKKPLRRNTVRYVDAVIKNVLQSVLLVLTYYGVVGALIAVIALPRSGTAWTAFSVILALASLGSLRLRNNYRTEPSAKLFMRLMRILHLADRYRRHWNSPAFKQTLLRHIDVASRLLEIGLYRQYRSSDASFNAWQRCRFAQMAAAMRALKPWIAVPGQLTYLDFTARIKHDLECVAFGNWDALTYIPEVSVKTESKLVYAWRIIRTILVAFLPAGGLITYHMLIPKSELHNGLLATVIIWIVVNLVPLLDPSFTSNVATLKDLVPLVSSKSDK